MTDYLCTSFLQYVCIVIVVVILEVAAAIVGFVLRGEIVSLCAQTICLSIIAFSTYCCCCTNEMYHACFMQANSANNKGEEAIGKYYPANNTNHDKSLNEAVDFVQETVSSHGTSVIYSLYVEYLYGGLSKSCNFI